MKTVSNGTTTNHATTKTDKQAPGFQRRKLGKFTVTALYDGIVALDPKAFTGVTQENKKRDLERQFLSTDGKIDTAVNAFILDTGSHVILLDVGSGHRFGPTMGRLTENMLASGYKPEDIDTILITHLHPDHVGGASSETLQAVYPNATLWVHKDDADFWLDNQFQERIPENQRWFFKVAQDAVSPYVTTKRFRTFTSEQLLLNGLIEVIPLPGHTPGHSGFRVKCDLETLMFWGDIAHMPAIQLMHPEATIELDISPELAIKSREYALAEAVSSGCLIAGSHLPFPGIGHLRKDSEGHTWIPSDYAELGTHN